MTSPTPRSHIEPLAVRQRIQRPQPQGLPKINMGYNELPYPPSPLVRSAIAEAMERVNSYGNPTCVELRSALSEIHDLPADSIICGNGSEELLDVIGRCFARPGEEILISAFGYIQFPIVANRVGAKLVKVPETDYTTDVDAILAGVSDKTRIVFLANPNNPTGTMCPVDELERLARTLPRNIVLTIDLAYGEFAGPGYCPAVHKLAKEFDNVIVTRTFSKAFGLAGLRVGWCVASESLVPALYAGRGMGTVNAVAQAAALAALNQPDTVADQVASIVAERERVAAACSQMGLHVVPSSTNFLMVGEPDDDGQRADALAEHVFDTAGIIVNRTREAGLERFIRFSMSLPGHNDLLLDSIRSFLAVAPTK